MGTPSMYGSFSFVTELDCDWATMDVRVFYTNHSEGVDLDKLEIKIILSGKIFFDIIP